MSWYVFDLDETLGDFYTPYYFLCDLQTKVFFKDTHPNTTIHIQPELAIELATIYNKFVSEIAKAEDSDTPLGILRPGILDIMRLIQKQISSGLAKGVIIYSNNGSLATLHFARDIIRSALGDSDFISDCIHWYHPLRKGEIVEGNPGLADKTFSVIQQAIQKVNNGPLVSPSQVIFFDDVLHPDMMKHLTEENYLVLNGYSYRTPFKKIAQIYQDAIQHSNIHNDNKLYSEYMKHLSKHCDIPIPKEAGHTTKFPQIQNIRSLTPNTSTLATAPPQDENTLNAMIQMIENQGIKEQKRQQEVTLLQNNKKVLSGGNRKHRNVGKKTRRYNRRR